MAVQKQDDQHEHTFSKYVSIRDVVQKTYLRRWMIGRSGERGSGISVLPARHDDDDESEKNIKDIKFFRTEGYLMVIYVFLSKFWPIVLFIIFFMYNPNVPEKAYLSHTVKTFI